jgi:membrane protein YqaA with SNARE-associated domain
MRFARPQAMALVLGAILGWFFGQFIATLFIVTEQRRGEEAAEKFLQELERDVQRDEWHAAASR